MAQARFDASTKHLIEFQPEGWLRFLQSLQPPRAGVAAATAATAATVDAADVTVIDADISSVSGAADKVLHVRAVKPRLMHLELQAGYDAGLPKRTLVSNVLLEYRHELPVQSVIILLARKADGPEMHGRIKRRAKDGNSPLVFKYDIVRLWQLPVETILAGPIGLLPLAPLTAITPAELPSVVRRIEGRFRDELPPGTASELWTSTFLLAGLRFHHAMIERVLQGVQNMEESVTYQIIAEREQAKGIAKGRTEGKAEGKAEGRAEEAQALLLRLGARRFGAIPTAEIRAAIENISDLAELERLADRLFDVETWDALLGR